jgi:hypothetical protein
MAPGRPSAGKGARAPCPTTVASVPDEFDPQAMVARFRERAAAVRDRGLPPVEGPERRRFMEQAQIDFMDFAMLGDAEAALEDGILTLRIDLRPRPAP